MPRAKKIEEVVEGKKPKKKEKAVKKPVVKEKKVLKEAKPVKAKKKEVAVKKEKVAKVKKSDSDKKPVKKSTMPNKVSRVKGWREITLVKVWLLNDFFREMLDIPFLSAGEHAEAGMWYSHLSDRQRVNILRCIQAQFCIYDEHELGKKILARICEELVFAR